MQFSPGKIIPTFKSRDLSMWLVISDSWSSLAVMPTVTMVLHTGVNISAIITCYKPTDTRSRVWKRCVSKHGMYFSQKFPCKGSGQSTSDNPWYPAHRKRNCFRWYWLYGTITYTNMSTSYNVIRMSIPHGRRQRGWRVQTVGAEQGLRSHAKIRGREDKKGIFLLQLCRNLIMCILDYFPDDWSQGLVWW
jgi:hypothetical protein